MKPEPAPANWEEQPLDWARTGGHADRLMAALDLRQKAQVRRRIAGTGAALALLVAGFAWYLPSRQTPAAPVVAAASPSKAVVTVPERRSLPDGTLVELKAG